MNKKFNELNLQACKWAAENVPVEQYENASIEKFAELIVMECVAVAKKQHNPSNLNYKPSERFVEDLRQHFGIKNVENTPTKNKHNI